MANTLAAKIAKASADVGGRLKADKTNTQDRYNYISADKILAECGQALAAVGAAVLPAMHDAEVNIGETAGGKRRFDARVAFVMTVTDGETEFTQPWFGFGADYTTPDKAVYKAITSGHKYFLSKLLMIGEGNEDGEHESETTGNTGGNGNVGTVTIATGNGAKAAEAAAQNSTNADGPSEGQHKMLFAVGVKLYGKDNWDGKRAELVKAVTHGRTESSTELSKAEMKKLLDGLKEKEKAMTEQAA